MSIAPHEELQVYQTDHARWVAKAAPGIAMRLQALEGEQLASTWALLKRETQVAVWALITDGVRARIESSRPRRQVATATAAGVAPNATRAPVSF